MIQQNFVPKVLFMTGLAAITAALFYNTLFNGFTNWDDEVYLHSNPYIRDLSFEGIKAIFTSVYFNNYHPLTTLSYTVEYHLAGLNPFIYHFNNYLLHIFNTLFLFLLMNKLTGQSVLAFMAALLFAVHPMHVESVAWVSARKDVLYLFFVLAALLSLLKFSENSRNSFFYAGAGMVLFLFALLSKPAAVVLPPLYLLCVYFKNTCVAKRDVVMSVLLCVPALVFSFITLNAQWDVVASAPDGFSVFDRFFILNYALLFYVVRFVAPLNFSALHAYEALESGNLPLWFYAAPLIILALVVMMFRLRGETKRYYNFAILFFVISILPLIQLIPVGEAYVSERYTYLSYSGFAVLAAFLFMRLYEVYKLKVLAPALLFLVFLMASTWQQNKVWANSVSLWTKAITVEPNIATAWNNRGIAQTKLGNYKEALTDFDKAITLAPNMATAYYNRAEIHAALGLNEAAIADYTSAITFNDTVSHYYNNRGIAYAATGNCPAALSDYYKARSLNSAITDEITQKCLHDSL